MNKLRWIILVLVVLMLALFVSAVSADTTYVVQPNEGLISIARRFGVDWLVLAAANDIEEPYVLQNGQVLRIPTDGQAPADAPQAPAPQAPAPQAPAPQAPAPRRARARASCTRARAGCPAAASVSARNLHSTEW